MTVHASRRIQDARGLSMAFDRSPERIISLVPSLTEALFEIGAGDRVVGVSTFCTEPAIARTRPRVGGPKNPDLDRVASLQPDLVILNLEENKPEHIEALSTRHRTWVTYPRRLVDAAMVMRDLGNILDMSDTTKPYVESIERTLESLNPWKKKRFRTLYVIWRLPWMSINQDTFIHDVLRLHGLDNVFADRTDRYCRISIDEIQRSNPEVVILPDEPFRFREKHVRELENLDIDAVKSDRVFLVEGSYFCWYGTRSARCSTYIQTSISNKLEQQGA